jgi:ABC-2 type transport system ATP-binding protein
MEKIIEVKNLSKRFKFRTNKNVITGIFKPQYQYTDAVKDISFFAEKGQSLAFLGPNGAGKTTTTKMLTGLMYPTAGEIKVMGYIPQNRDRDFLMQIGLVMGNKTGLSWDLTGLQNLQFIQKIYGIDQNVFTKRLNDLSELLDIQKHLHKQVRKLSLGERMKMELVGSIIHQPKILFLDEPTIGLDITSKKNIRKFLRQIQTEYNITLLLTSHDMDDIEHVCDRVIVINHGEKVYDDYLSGLLSQYKSTKYIRVYFEILPKDLTSLGNVAHVESLKEDSVVFEVEKSRQSEFLAKITQDFKVDDIDILSIPLEEIIEDIFKKSNIPLSLNDN